MGTAGRMYVCAVLQQQLDEAGAPIFRCFVKGNLAHPCVAVSCPRHWGTARSSSPTIQPPQNHSPSTTSAPAPHERLTRWGTCTSCFDSDGASVSSPGGSRHRPGGTSALRLEHEAQKSPPQYRQWCRRLMRSSKLTWHYVSGGGGSGGDGDGE